MNVICWLNGVSAVGDDPGGGGGGLADDQRCKAYQNEIGLHRSDPGEWVLNPLRKLTLAHHENWFVAFVLAE